MLLTKAILLMLLLATPVKIVVWAVFILSGISLIMLYAVPNTPATLRHPPPLPNGEGATVLTGIVKEYETNRTGDIDKLLLGNNDSSYTIMFPPHTARQIMTTAPKGIYVEIVARPGKPAPENFVAYRLVKMTIGEIAVLPENIPPPSAGKPIVVSGTVQQLLTNNQGEVTGFMLDSFWIMIPPHFSRSISPLLQQNGFVQVQGYERNTSDGFVNSYGAHLLKPYRITIDSTDYLL